MMCLHWDETTDLFLRFDFKKLLPSPVHHTLVVFHTKDLHKLDCEANYLMADIDDCQTQAALLPESLPECPPTPEVLSQEIRMVTHPRCIPFWQQHDDSLCYYHSHSGEQDHKHSSQGSWPGNGQAGSHAVVPHVLCEIATYCNECLQ